MSDPNEIFGPVIRETVRVLKEMAKTDSLEDRKLQSEIVNNLCQSIGMFLDLMSSTAIDSDYLDYDEEE